MLFVDEEQVTAQELCQKFGLDFDKISKAPQFENKDIYIDPISKKEKFNNGTSLKSRFFARDPQTGKEVKIQYAKGYSNKTIGEKLLKVYEPVYVHYQGKIFSNYTDIDLAVFFALHPISVTSPVKTQKPIKKKIEFIDKHARAVKEVQEMDLHDKAVFHAKNASYEQLIMIAKGLHFKEVDSMDEIELRAAVRRYAIGNVKKYVEATESNIVKVEGRVRDLVDKKVFVLQTQGITRQWYWAKGSDEGSTIGEQITNKMQDAVEYLVNYVLNNPENIVHKLFEVHEHVTVREKAKSFLDGIDLPTGEPKATTSSAGDIYVELPPSFDNESVKQFVNEHGYKMLPADVKALRLGFEDGSIQSHNVLQYMEKHFQKKVEY